MRLLIIGGGIAGASAAYFAAQAGHRVTLLDAGAGRSSDVPAALLNPVRGQSGKVEPQALAGLRCTWALIAELQAAGQHIPHGQTGVLRPVPDEKTQRKWAAALPTELPHIWRGPAGLPPSWQSVLELPEGGWVSGAAFVGALKRASGARLMRGKAARIWASGAALESGEILEAERVIFCGGSLGAEFSHQNGGEQSSHLEGATHRAGSLLLLSQAPQQPLSFGAYLSPAAVGGVLGATFEAPAVSHAAALAGGLPFKSLDWLLQKGAALSDLGGVQVTGRWTGVRLSPLRSEPDAAGVYHLSGLGSKGFLLGPLLARELVRELSG
ncbi:FAD-dependent oxidoreductase [Deinococcus detaillensis]|uniref:FAD-dependent oxidoreductase n=1 Tax=Deinococcus detaillensis TaxID=2592048 RepID=UPI001CDC5896|nr:FAD-dependent oxidoreductase [Deinococcus detaillensis]